MISQKQKLCQARCSRVIVLTETIDLYKPIEYEGYMGFCFFFCVRDTAAARGQYLALSNA